MKKQASLMPNIFATAPLICEIFANWNIKKRNAGFMEFGYGNVFKLNSQNFPNAKHVDMLDKI